MRSPDAHVSPRNTPSVLQRMHKFPIKQMWVILGPKGVGGWWIDLAEKLEPLPDMWGAEGGVSKKEMELCSPPWRVLLLKSPQMRAEGGKVSKHQHTKYQLRKNFYVCTLVRTFRLASDYTNLVDSCFPSPCWGRVSLLELTTALLLLKTSNNPLLSAGPKSTCSVHVSQSDYSRLFASLCFHTLSKFLHLSNKLSILVIYQIQCQACCKLWLMFLSLRTPYFFPLSKCYLLPHFSWSPALPSEPSPT